MQDRTFLITGATGKTGRLVADRLEARGVAVRRVTRGSAIPFDWTDRATWQGALTGIHAAYITYQPDLAVPGSVDDIRAFSALAVELGVRRLVLLSGRGEEEAVAAEEALKEAGADWTILSASWFHQNFSEGFFTDMLKGGELVLPAGDVREPFVDTRDIADMAIKALTEEGHAGRKYEITGSRLMTFAQATADVARAAGRDIRYTRVNVADYARMLKAEGVPDDYVWLVTYLFTSVLDGRNESVSGDVEAVLGRPPRDFADFAREAAVTGIWEA